MRPFRCRKILSINIGKAERIPGDNSVTVTKLDDGVDCQYLKMRTLGIVEAQEAMETGVSIRENGYQDSMTRSAKRRETGPGIRNKGNMNAENAMSGLSDHAHRLFTRPQRETEA
jgi:hypothetical protein